ncbi:MAG TPA: glycosyltransferase family 4 protein [Terriglobales bacterium]|jgi:glycosyltransferase involved in cell wall biosynthesis|nr:glycosyltransferase family 4 protein [Terriglobales bacterium]
MKLLFVVTEDWYFLSHRLPIAEAAQRAGYDVAVATRVTAHGHEILQRGFSLIPLHHFKGESLSLWNEPRVIAELRRIYLKERPDIIHHIALKAVIHGSIAGLGLNVQTINAIAGLGFMESSWSPKPAILRFCASKLLRFLLTRPNSLTLLQNFDDRNFVIKYFKVPIENTKVIMESGVNMDVFRPSPEPFGTPIVMLPSCLLWNKGVAEFVAAAESLKASGVQARFVLAGDTDEFSPSAIPRSRLAEWNDSGSVEWWGKMDNMQGVLPQASIICLPSYREGLPKVLIEAAACGRPIVTTDVPGCRDVVQHYVNGMLVPARDSEVLALSILVLLRNRNLRERMGEAGRNIAARFSQDVVCEKILDLYVAHCLGK